MKTNFILALAPMLLSLAGCPADDEGDDAADTGADDGNDGNDAPDDGNDAPDDGVDESGGNVGQCGDGGEEVLFYDPPGECYNNAGCSTCNCRTFRDNPPTAEATCDEDPADGMMTITATLLEFPGQTPIPSQEVTIYNALDIGTVGPENATAIGMATADAQGQIDLRVEPKDQIGIVATVRAEGFADTATGLAKPPYEASNAIHDLFAVPLADVEAWSTELALDEALAMFLPLGENGGVVGVARSRYTGEPMAGIKIVSLGAASTAELRYLNEDGTFNGDATTATGIYVLLGPQLAEEFEAQQDGAVVSTRPNKAGSGAPAVFTMNLTINIDPGANPFE